MAFFKQPFRGISQRAIAWIACIAILTGALAPAISHAIAGVKGQAAPWEQICSTSGNKFVPFDNARNSTDDSDSNSGPMSMEHCAYCLAHAPSLYLPNSDTFVFYPAKSRTEFPALFYQAHHPLLIWSSSNPRAPPSFL